MNVLFEEDGSFKTGTVLADNDSSLQVETSTGKRIKLKLANVLLRFATPAPAELLTRAQAEAESLETEFLWEMCGEEDFAFTEFAEEYYGHAPSAVESAAVLIRLFSAPVYFHRKGKGRYRKAPPEILQAALAGQEKKRVQQEQVERMKNELLADKLPAEFAPMLWQLLYKPDRNRIETKALEAACAQSNTSVARLMLKIGALPSSHDFHLGRFLYDYFPEVMTPQDSYTTNLGKYLLNYFPEKIELPSLIAPDFKEDELPLADVRSFSLDDASTTEIDDALSLCEREGGGWRVGVHIAAPALSIEQDSIFDTIARRRLSTVYMPGNKITMLPGAVIDTFTLGEGVPRPAVSLYIDVNADFSIEGFESRIERVPVVANLRLHELEPLFNDETVQAETPDFEWKRELTILWNFACVLEKARGKPSSNPNMCDYNYSVDWDVQTPDGPGQVQIEMRRRGAPLDKMISELMILTNSTWGKMLHEAGIPAMYRAQGGGKVRMTTAAAPHEGLGVECYAWTTSPLRRYVDMCNQWQLISYLREEIPQFPPGSARLAAAMNDFEMTYAAYAQLQRDMERYWCVRWLRQNGKKEVTARVLRNSIVRLEEVPLVFKVHSLPVLASGTRVQLLVEACDLIEVDVRAKYVATLAALEDEPETVLIDEQMAQELEDLEAPPQESDPAVTKDSEETVAPA